MGSLLTEAFVLAPYWRTLEPKAFLALYATLGPRLYKYFSPLTILATVLTVIAALLPIVMGSPISVLSLVPSILVLAMLAIYFMYFKAANSSFKTGVIEVDAVSAELTAWANWHWVRVLLGIVAFIISLAILLL